MGRTVGILWIVAVLSACGDAHVGNAFDAAPFDATVIDGADPCAGLDVPTCRSTAGCEALFCSDCTCGQAYMGCTSGGDPQGAECPPLLCPAPTCCADGADCDAVSEECHHPGESPGCGVPNIDPGDCAIDAECNTAGGEICDPIACSTVGASHCVMGCAAEGDCPIGTTCSVDHRCTSRPCDAGDPCPTDFQCNEGFCARAPCALDVDCAGFCVESLCYDGLGICAPIPQ